LAPASTRRPTRRRTAGPWSAPASPPRPSSARFYPLSSNPLTPHSLLLVAYCHGLVWRGAWILAADWGCRIRRVNLIGTHWPISFRETWRIMNWANRSLPAFSSMNVEVYGRLVLITVASSNAGQLSFASGRCAQYDLLCNIHIMIMWECNLQIPPSGFSVLDS